MRKNMEMGRKHNSEKKERQRFRVAGRKLIRSFAEPQMSTLECVDEGLQILYQIYKGKCPS